MLIAQVFHPNICRLLGISSDGPQRCLVLELCPAGSLYDALNKDRKELADGFPPMLSWRARLEVMVGAARALVRLCSAPPSQRWRARGMFARRGQGT